MSIRPATERALLDPAGRVFPIDEDRGGRFDRKPTRQRAEPAEHALLVRSKQLTAPRDRRIHRLLPLGKIPRADGGSRQQNILIEPAEQILRSQRFQPRRGEFDGER